MFRKIIVLLFIIFSGVIFSGCSLKKAPAALQIITKPTANVFIDGKLLGKTPYQTSSLKAGEVSIKLIPETETQPLISWEGKIKVNSGVLTLVEREFAASEVASSGHILTLEKQKDKGQISLSVVSDPDGALVKLDGESKGFTPLVIDKIAEADHEIVVSKDGYTEKVINAKAISGYKLVVNAKLGLGQVVVPTPTPNVSLMTTPQPTGKDKKPTPTTTIKITPKTTPSPGAAGTSGSVLIKETPTGFLRVRSSPVSGEEVAQVKPGETYPLLEEKSGWYKIVYEEGKEGWISGTYATKE